MIVTYVSEALIYCSDFSENKEFESVRRDDLSKKDLDLSRTQFEARYLIQFCVMVCVIKETEVYGTTSSGQVYTHSLYGN